jgi:tRNA A58 N-methylase Trm61
LRGWIYDAALLPLTTRWYGEVLRRLPERTRLLDVGIGTGGALAANAELVRKMDLQVVGVDIDAHYVERAQQAMLRAGLADRVQVRLQSVTDHVEGPYGAVYFSASFMLMPDPAAVLRHVGGQLEPGGRVFFTQTFHDRPSPLMERIKPLLGRVTTIEFGRVTYEADFLQTVAAGGFKVVEMVTMQASGHRSYRLIAAIPE